MNNFGHLKLFECILQWSGEGLRKEAATDVCGHLEKSRDARRVAPVPYPVTLNHSKVS